jgi:hypothetical protein
MINASSLWDSFSTMQRGKNDQSKVGFPIAIFLQRGAELSDKIGEVIIKNTCSQYENTLAARSGTIFIALTETDSNHKSVIIIMASEIALGCKVWKYRSKISLPQIALHRYWKANFRSYWPVKR